MDFSTTEAAADLGGLVDTIVDSVCTPERQRELDKLDERFDRDLWRKLKDADILSTAAPASLGGDGFGALEQVAVLVALGRQLAAVPYLDSVALAAGALARFGSEELQQAWAVPAVNGDKILTVALDGDMGEGPVPSNGERRRLPPHRYPHPGRLRPGGRCVSRTRRNRFRHQVFVVAKADAGVSVSRWTPPASAASGISSSMVSNSGSTGSAAVMTSSAGCPHLPRWAAAHFSSGCLIAGWS